jgi:hypothetical protein
MVDPNQRGYYRIEYPRAERPALILAGQTLEVVNCAERGLRYLLPETEPRPAVGSEVRGIVRFRTGTEVAVEGVVVGVYEQSAALRLNGSGIPFAAILAEQHYLRRRYSH